jgi:hypothetical protein
VHLVARLADEAAGGGGVPRRLVERPLEQVSLERLARVLELRPAEPRVDDERSVGVDRSSSAEYCVSALGTGRSPRAPARATRREGESLGFFRRAPRKSSKSVQTTISWKPKFERHSRRFASPFRRME